MTATKSTYPSDPSITVYGFVTDPKLVGYQVLTNYESTYWAPLVGSEAWRLYEVLRSFCHQGHSSCHPSINLLLAILGIKDRSVLIGRSKPKIVKGKKYYYPGLIQILQEHNLVIAEVEGDGPTMRYIFHVHMTPGLLTPEKLAQLPELLQKKHAELLERCAEEQRKLKAKKRPPKLQPNGDRTQSESAESQGIGNSNTPLGNSNTPSWKFQAEQQPINNTHRTRADARTDHNNSSGPNDTKQDVVVALSNNGIAENVAKRLAHRYSRKRVTEKIAYLEFLLDEAPEKVQYPTGWLRRAVEENYGPPDGYLSPEERERQQTEEARKAQEEVKQARLLEEIEQAFQEKKKTEQDARRQALTEQYGTTEEDFAFWEQAQWEIKYATPAHISALTADMDILKVTDETVVVGVERADVYRQLQHPNIQKAINRAVSAVFGRNTGLEVVEL